MSESRAAGVTMGETSAAATTAAATAANQVSASESDCLSFATNSSSSDTASVDKTNAFRTLFPGVLHQILEDARKKEFVSIVSWNEDGKSFKIHDRDAFVDVILPRYSINQSKYKSFVRQLNIWGFSCVHGGRRNPLRGSYTNKNFIRGNPELCRHMERTKIKGLRKAKAALAKQTKQSKASAQVVPQRIMPKIQSSLPALPNSGNAKFPTQPLSFPAVVSSPQLKTVLVADESSPESTISEFQCLQQVWNNEPLVPPSLAPHGVVASTATASTISPMQRFFDTLNPMADVANMGSSMNAPLQHSASTESSSSLGMSTISSIHSNEHPVTAKDCITQQSNSVFSPLTDENIGDHNECNQWQFDLSRDPWHVNAHMWKDGDEAVNAQKQQKQQYFDSALHPLPFSTQAPQPAQQNNVARNCNGTPSASNCPQQEQYGLNTSCATDVVDSAKPTDRSTCSSLSAIFDEFMEQIAVPL